jgi:hypothetical protein
MIKAFVYDVLIIHMAKVPQQAVIVMTGAAVTKANPTIACFLCLCVYVLIIHQHSSSHNRMFDRQMTHIRSSSVLIQEVYQ